MKLKLHELTEPLSFSLSEETQWIQPIFTQLDLSFKKPLSIHVTIERNKEDIFVQGHIKGVLILNCSRCVEDFEYKVDEFFSPVFTHGKDPHHKDIELSPCELEISYFEGDEIDLSEIIQEQILLVIPLKPLCKEICKGICVHCGQNLNIKKCQCKKRCATTPFSVLKDVKVKK